MENGTNCICYSQELETDGQTRCDGFLMAATRMMMKAPILIKPAAQWAEVLLNSLPYALSSAKMAAPPPTAVSAPEKAHRERGGEEHCTVSPPLWNFKMTLKWQQHPPGGCKDIVMSSLSLNLQV